MYFLHPNIFSLLHLVNAFACVLDDTSSELRPLLKQSYSNPEFEERTRNLAYISEYNSMPATLDISHDWVCKQLYLRSQSRIQ